MAETIRAFVTGHPIGHSRSPMIHGHWLREAGIDGSYQAVDVAPQDFADFLKSVADGSSGFAGGNVTIPHKPAAFELADHADAIATELGAANTLWREDGRLMATNTDGYGFCANLDQWSPGWDDTDTAVILGAGGASRAIIQTVRDRGVGNIHIVNRTVARAVELAERFGAGIRAHGLGALNEVSAGAGLFVNTSALGMEGTQVPEIDFSGMSKGAVVTDIVYTPLVTPILRMARSQGLQVVDGLGMLLHQAVPGFERWFGVRPQVTGELRDLVVRDLEDGE